MVSVIERVQYEFHAGRDTEFLENPEKILLDGVLAERQFMGDLTVGKPFGHQGDDGTWETISIRKSICSAVAQI